MSEKQQQQQSGSNDGDQGSGMVQVKYGLHDAYIPSGTTVEMAIKRLAKELSMPGNVKAAVRGKTVQNSYVLQDGDQLTFVRPAGEKG